MQEQEPTLQQINDDASIGAAEAQLAPAAVALGEAKLDVGFATISKRKLREIQKVAREVEQFHIAAMIEDLLT